MALTLRTALALAVTLLIPSSASAATTIGSTMPAWGGEVLDCDPGGCTFVPTSISGAPIAVPFDGVIVSWSARVPAGGPAVDLRVVRPGAGGAFEAAGKDIGLAAADGAIAESARLRVKAGDLIGVDLASGEELAVVSHPSFDSASHTFLPRLGDLESRVPDLTEPDDFEALFNAVIEPDADGDGYGDETQDRCPGLAELNTRSCTGTASLGVTTDAVRSPKLGSALILAGRSLHISARVRPFSTHRLPDVVVSFRLPPELRGVSGQGCSVASERIECRLGDLGASATATATIEVQALRPGTASLLPGAPPVAKFDVALTTGLRPTPQLSSHFVRVLATGACSNRNRLPWFEPPTFAGDQIIAGGAIDKLNGLGGDDCMAGKDGNDVLGGGDGNDRVDGGPGKDLVRGENGDDYLIGGIGIDRLEGGPGADRIGAVDKQRDIVRCGDGRDRARVDRIDSVAGCETVTRVPAVKKKPRRR